MEKIIFFARSPFSPKNVSKLHKQTLLSEIIFQIGKISVFFPVLTQEFC